MAEHQRRLSPFGFSWFSALRDAFQPQPSQPHERPAASQRQPFLPAGKAPVHAFTSQTEAQQKSGRASTEKDPKQPPTSKSQAQPKNDTSSWKVPAQPSPSQSQAMHKSKTQTPVPSPKSQTRGISKPSSEPRSANQPQTASVPSSRQLIASLSQQSSREGHSPSHLTSEPSGQKKVPASSSLHPSNGQPLKIPAESLSPLKTEQSPTKKSSKPYPGSAQPSRATSEAAKGTVLQALLQGIKPTADTKSEEGGNPLTSQKPPQELKPKAEFEVEPEITSRKKEEVNPLASQKPVQELNTKAESKAEPEITSWMQEEGNRSESQRPTQELKPTAESKVKPASTPKNLSPVATTSQTDSDTGKPTRIPSPEVSNQKSDSDTNNGEKLTSKLERELENTEEKWNVVRENIKEEAKGTDKDDQKSIEKTFSPQSTSVSSKKTNDLTTKFQSESGKEKKVTSSKGSEIKNLSSISDKSKGIHNVHARTHQRPQASNVQNAPLHKAIREKLPKYLPKMAPGNSTKLLMDRKPVSAMTISGKNKRATMHVDSSSKKYDFIHIHRGYKRKGPESTTAGGNFEGRKSKYQDSKEEDAYINSNIQSSNNSLLLSSSVSERKPGVHFAFFSKPRNRPALV